MPHILYKMCIYSNKKTYDFCYIVQKSYNNWTIIKMYWYKAKEKMWKDVFTSEEYGK